MKFYSMLANEMPFVVCINVLHCIFNKVFEIFVLEQSCLFAKDRYERLVHLISNTLAWRRLNSYKQTKMCFVYISNSMTNGTSASLTYLAYVFKLWALCDIQHRT